MACHHVTIFHGDRQYACPGESIAGEAAVTGFDSVGDRHARRIICEVQSQPRRQVMPRLSCQSIPFAWFKSA
jgi:hypothetical protein